jgi:glycosyltransferase involved in cell wall biosynthesis
MTEKKLIVVLPAYNEVHHVKPTLRALHRQSDQDFDVVFVDNHSTDGTSYVIKEFIAEQRITRWHVIDEPQKGTGAAADTGMRWAAEHGADIIARTDTDCLPRQDWVEQIKAEFDAGTRFIAGKLKPRTDEYPLPSWQYKVLDGAVVVAEAFGKVRPSNKGPHFKGPYIMTAGCNVAIEAALYLECGGFPRTKIEDVHEDRALINNVRRYTDKYVAAKDVVVYSSTRRVKEWGLWNTLMWYADHRYKPDVVDIR